MNFNNVSIGDPIPFGDNQKRRTVILEDAESHPLECTFFDNWADMFNDINDNRESLGHVVIILQLAKVKYWNEKSQVGNALFGMKIYINSDLPEIVAFKESCKIKHYSPEKTVVMTESFFERACKKTVGAIRDSNADTTLVVYAKIHKIHKEHGWQYLACRRCNTAVKEQATKAGARPSASKKPTYKCEAHGLQVPVPKYKVIVRVIDDTRSASLVRFDKMVHNLVDFAVHSHEKDLAMSNNHSKKTIQRLRVWERETRD
ncbi:nucleic acid-binding, OB-fold protein [Artemisia annua]|uniref:Nucleic acid-binding, OB-fold protein n=1 Tax=Artemisia annua TaxID=35608 RepID=A0A2U1PCQ0_ARTAN|nr:nucleic acid-binding, OB-fold protein [Artemisia annua]